MIVGDFLKALAQFSDRRFRRVLWLGLGLTLLLLFAMTVLFIGLVQWVFPETLSLPVIGEISWVGDAFSFAVVAAMMVLSVFLMVPVASVTLSTALSAICFGDRGTCGLRSCVPPEPVTAQVMKTSRFMVNGIWFSWISDSSTETD